MTRKNLFALALAGVMALSTAVPAFASPNTDEVSSQDVDVSVTGSIETPTIKVTIPQSLTVVMNPYQLKVPIPNTDLVSQDQILFAEQKVTNKSNVPLKVTARILATMPSKNVTLSDTDAADLSTKSVHLQGDFVTSTSGTADWTAQSVTKIDATTDKKAEASEAASLAATDTTTPNYLHYKLSGDVAKAPATAWGADDKITVAIAFSFIPQEVELEKGIKFVGDSTAFTSDKGSIAFQVDSALIGSKVTFTITPADGKTLTANSVKIVKGYKDASGTATTDDFALTAGTDGKFTINLTSEGNDKVSVKDGETLTITAAFADGTGG